MEQPVLVADDQHVKRGVVTSAAQFHQLMVVEVLHEGRFAMRSVQGVIEVEGVGGAGCRNSQIENPMPRPNSSRLKHCEMVSPVPN